MKKNKAKNKENIKKLLAFISKQKTKDIKK